MKGMYRDLGLHLWLYNDIDDVLGIFAVDMNIYNHIINHKEHIFETIGGTSKLLFTCRKSVYKEAFKLGLFVTETIVDLESKDNQLTETEKMAICKYHCEAKSVSWCKRSTDNLLSLTRHKTRAAY
jgi:hypothetical protein